MFGLLFAAAVAVLVGGFALAMRGHLAFTPDSWTYYELARSMPGDFYRLHLTRQFQFVSPYGASFPPLWPMLIALADGLTGAGPVVAYWLAALSAGLFAVLSEAGGRRCFATRWVGLAAAVLILSHAGLIDEITGGRSIPLQLCLYAALLWVLAAPDGARRWGLAGLLSGLAVMNRFDALPLAVVLAGAVAVLARRRWLAAGAVYIGALLIVLTPWIAYSRLRFGRWFASDNGGVAFSPDRQAYVTDWWPAPQPTAFDAPVDWLLKVAGNALRLVPEMVVSPGLATLMVWLVAALVIRAVYRWARVEGTGKAAPGRGALIACGLALFALLPGYMLTGYLDGRYFTPQLWLAALVAMGRAAQRLGGPARRDRFGAMVAATCLTAAALVLTARALWPPPPALPQFPHDPRDTTLARCLAASPAPPVILAADAAQGARWSALYRWDVVLVPRNFVRLGDAERRTFLARYRITHFAPDGGDVAALLPLTPLPGCPAGIAAVSPSARSPGG